MISLFIFCWVEGIFSKLLDLLPKNWEEQDGTIWFNVISSDGMSHRIVILKGKLSEEASRYAFVKLDAELVSLVCKRFTNKELAMMGLRKIVAEKKGDEPLDNTIGFAFEYKS